MRKKYFIQTAKYVEVQHKNKKRGMPFMVYE